MPPPFGFTTLGLAECTSTRPPPHHNRRAHKYATLFPIFYLIVYLLVYVCEAFTDDSFHCQERRSNKNATSNSTANHYRSFKKWKPGASSGSHLVKGELQNRDVKCCDTWGGKLRLEYASKNPNADRLSNANP